MSSGKWRPFCLGLNVLINSQRNIEQIMSDFVVIKVTAGGSTPLGARTFVGTVMFNSKADSRSAPSQWETALLCKDVSHRLGTNLESALKYETLDPMYIWDQH